MQFLLNQVYKKHQNTTTTATKFIKNIQKLQNQKLCEKFHHPKIIAKLNTCEIKHYHTREIKKKTLRYTSTPSHRREQLASSNINTHVAILFDDVVCSCE